jgi:hypothetical protein
MNSTTKDTKFHEGRIKLRGLMGFVLFVSFVVENKK